MSFAFRGFYSEKEARIEDQPRCTRTLSFPKHAQGIHNLLENCRCQEMCLPGVFLAMSPRKNPGVEE